MSYHQDAVIWQSQDGTWSYAHFVDLGCGGCDGDDETHEWCRDFDQNAFSHASTGHQSQDAAWKSWTGSNPGSHTVFGQVGGDGEVDGECERLDDLAAQLYERELREDRRYRRYSGPPRQRTLRGLQADRDMPLIAWADQAGRGYLSPGYAPDPDLDAKVARRLEQASAEEKAAFEAADAQTGRRLADALTELDTPQRRPTWGMTVRDVGEERQRRATAREALVQAIADHEAAAVARAPKPRARKAAKKAPVKATPPSRTTPSATRRAKTSSSSTAGSFAPTRRSEADVNLGPIGTDPWS